MYTDLMMKRIMQISGAVIGITVLFLLLALYISPGVQGGEPDTEESTGQEEEIIEDGLFLIMEHDTIEETLLLYSYEKEEEITYGYSFQTEFLDKYGQKKPAIRFSVGQAVTGLKVDTDGYLTQVCQSEQVKVMEQVRRFAVDITKGVFTISNTNYSVQEKTFVFSQDKQIGLAELTSNDILTVVSLDNKILSVVVTTGHGTLSLSNTELFEGSMLKLNDDIYAMITKDMVMEVQEGTYTLTVANDGWGSSKEITITRGQTTEVDLDAMKGEGKKKSMITFRVNVDDVKVYVDYEPVDHSQPVEITYGTHRLTVTAEGYETWKRYLVVNSETAVIIIELEEGDGDSSSSSEEESQFQSESEEEGKSSES